MITMWRTKIPASAAAIVLILASGDAVAGGSCLIKMDTGTPRSEVNSAIANFGARVIAVGRVDAVAPEFGVEVLGVKVGPSALDSFQIGDYAVVIDWSKPGAVERLLEVRPLSSRYVPGVSEVFLRSKVTGNDLLSARVQLGKVGVDYSSSIVLVDRSGAVVGSTMAIRGIQPQPSGVILGSCVSILRNNGSLGTGKPDGSLGTGRADGSLGTGRTDGSLGTGSPEGSLGTGKPDGSLGTGWISRVLWEPAVLRVRLALASRTVRSAPGAPMGPWEPVAQTVRWELGVPRVRLALASRTVRSAPGAPMGPWEPVAQTVRWELGVPRVRLALASRTVRLVRAG